MGQNDNCTILVLPSLGQSSGGILPPVTTGITVYQYIIDGIAQV